MGFPPKVYQFLVGTFAALGSFLYGYDLTIVAEGKLAKQHGMHPIIYSQELTTVDVFFSQWYPAVRS